MELQPDTTLVPPAKPPRWQRPNHVFDRRTKAARRFALLIADFTAQLGGKGVVSEARLAIVHQLASTIIKAEEMQAAVVRGEVVDTEQMVRLVNLQARLTRQLGLDDAAAKPRPRTLQDHLAEREGRAA